MLANAADGDDTLKKILANTEQMMAVFPAIALASNPFQSASSLSNEENKQKANDFKTSLLLYYFNQRPPGPTPGLLVQQPQHMPMFTIQCMVSQLVLDSNIVEAAHILPKASAKVSFNWLMHIEHRKTQGMLGIYGTHCTTWAMVCL